MAFWSTKAAISLKRVKIEVKLLWGAYRNSPTLFRTAPSPTPTASPSPRFLFAPHPKLQSLLTQERVKLLRISNLASIFRGSIRTKSHEKFWRKVSVGVSRDCPVFRVPPIISGTGKAMDFKFGHTFRGSDRTKAH